MKQECIPVGCVPPAAVAVPGGLHQAPPLEQTSPWTRYHPRTKPPREQTPPCGQTHACKHYLARNFVWGGNNDLTSWLLANLFVLHESLQSCQIIALHAFQRFQEALQREKERIKNHFSEGSGASCKITSLFFHLQTDRWKANCNCSLSGFNENKLWYFNYLKQQKQPNITCRCLLYLSLIAGSKKLLRKHFYSEITAYMKHCLD